MKKYAETLDLPTPDPESGHEGLPRPGIVLIATGGLPYAIPLPLDGAHALLIGRGELAASLAEDARLSRRHATVALEGAEWVVKDLGSRNGTRVDGVRISGEYRGPMPRTIRTGDTLFLVQSDLRALLATPMLVTADHVSGPALSAVWTKLTLAAKLGGNLHLFGETGCGKEVAARAFHQLGPAASGPFVAVNCATIPEGIAERVLFGARKGTYSGAHADAEGLVVAAHQGTLFLDEVGELDPSVQAKLLRVVEAKEVTPLGATKARPVDIRICSATHHDLREAVSQKRFREDLYFRLGRPSVELPPLRERKEEIAWLIALALRTRRFTAHASLVEACCLRPWPGNVRELLHAIEAAALEAAEDGREVVMAADLDDDAGRAFDANTVPTTAATPVAAAAQGAQDDESIEAALQAAAGNVSRAARALGMHRTQLRRWIAKKRPSNDDGDE